MSEPVFLIITATPNVSERRAHDEYLRKAAPICAHHGAVRVANYRLSEALDGQDKPEHCLVVSFPTRQAIFNVFTDPKYQRLVKLRDMGFTAIRYFIGSERID